MDLLLDKDRVIDYWCRKERNDDGVRTCYSEGSLWAQISYSLAKEETATRDER